MFGSDSYTPKYKLVVYVPNEHPLADRLNRYRKKFGFKVIIRDPKFWDGRVERADSVAVESLSSPLAVAYRKAGIEVRALRERRTEVKEAVIDFDRQEERETQTKLNIPLTKKSKEVARKWKAKQARRS